MAQTPSSRRGEGSRQTRPLEAARVQPPPELSGDTAAFPWTDALAIGWGFSRSWHRPDPGGGGATRGRWEEA